MIKTKRKAQAQIVAIGKGTVAVILAGVIVRVLGEITENTSIANFGNTVFWIGVLLTVFYLAPRILRFFV